MPELASRRAGATGPADPQRNPIGTARSASPPCGRCPAGLWVQAGTKCSHAIGRRAALHHQEHASPRSPALPPAAGEAGRAIGLPCSGPKARLRRASACSPSPAFGGRAPKPLDTLESARQPKAGQCARRLQGIAVPLCGGSILQREPYAKREHKRGRAATPLFSWFALGSCPAGFRGLLGPRAQGMPPPLRAGRCLPWAARRQAKQRSACQGSLRRLGVVEKGGGTASA